MSTMDRMKELLHHIEVCVWDTNTTDEEKVRGIQGYLYQYDQMQDRLTQDLFGDDDAHVESPNMRRI